MKKGLRLITIFSLIMMLVLLVSCSKVTDKNYDKIEVGMKQADVISVMGEANDSTVVGNYKTFYWFDGASSYQEAQTKTASGKSVKFIEVTFSNSLVITKNHGTWTLR